MCQRVPRRVRQVLGPMTPSAVRWWFFWKERVADLVAGGPKLPSTVRL